MPTYEQLIEMEKQVEELEKEYKRKAEDMKKIEENIKTIQKFLRIEFSKLGKNRMVDETKEVLENLVVDKSKTKSNKSYTAVIVIGIIILLFLIF